MMKIEMIAPARPSENQQPITNPHVLWNIQAAHFKLKQALDAVGSEAITSYDLQNALMNATRASDNLELAMKDIIAASSTHNEQAAAAAGIDLKLPPDGPQGWVLAHVEEVQYIAVCRFDADGAIFRPHINIEREYFPEIPRVGDPIWVSNVVGYISSARPALKDAGRALSDALNQQQVPA